MLFRSQGSDTIARGFMQPPVGPAFVGVPSASPKGSRISWFLVVVGCLYFILLALGATRAIPHFAKLYGEAGVGLPLLTRILLSSHFWFLPIAFTVAAILTVAKKLAEFSRLQLRVVNVVLIFLGAVLPALLVWFLCSPLFGLIGKLDGAH